MAFRAVGEGSGQRLDMDRYDSHYDHIVLWSPDDLEVVGAYRVKRTADITANRWQTDLYSLSLFKVNTTQMAEVFADGLELGRSFVQPRFWGKRSLDYLWQGIGAYLRRYPARFLFGPVTISGALPRRAQDALVYFYRSHFSHPKYTVEPNVPYPLDANCMVELNAIISHAELKTDFANLKAHLAHMGCAIPTLYKQYSELCQPGGVHFLSFSVDLDFANCVDGLVLVDAQKLKPKKRKRYLESAE